MAKRRFLADELADLINPAPTAEFDPDVEAGVRTALNESDDELLAAADAPARPTRERRLRMRSSIALSQGDYRGARSSRAVVFGEATASASDGDEPSTSAEADSGGSGGGHARPNGHAFVNGDPPGSEGDSQGGGTDGSASGGEEDGGAGSGGSGGATGLGGAAQRDEAELRRLEREYAQLAEQGAQARVMDVRRSEKQAAKAAAVRAQQAVWERALELRILLQRPLGAAARLPLEPAAGAARAAHAPLTDGYAALRDACQATLEDLLQLQAALLERLPPAAVGAGGAEGRAPEAGGAEPRRARLAGVEGAWAAVEGAHRRFAPFRDAALDKWHRRTVLASGSAALKGAAGLRALAQPVSAQVATLLRDRARLVQRTRLPGALAQRPLCTTDEAWRERQRAGGAADAGDADDADWRDVETFDDGEFYQQLLKEFLEASGASGAAAAAVRGPKRRKVVDRRASKGRKLRFHVMDKLVGFCAPAPSELPPFAEQLFGNLFA